MDICKINKDATTYNIRYKRSKIIRRLVFNDGLLFVFGCLKKKGLSGVGNKP
jgi:hypothetical protein